MVRGDTGVDLGDWRRGIVYGGLGFAALTAMGHGAREGAHSYYF